MKDADTPDHPFAGLYESSHRLLRVMEAVRDVEGDAAIGDRYAEYGRRIHVAQDVEFDPAEALDAVNLDRCFASAADEDSWHEAISTSTAERLSLTGNDVGTPIMGFDDIDGSPVGIFGPVISRNLDLDVALRLWDGVHAAATIPGFWELERTRTERPEVGFHPRK